MEEPRLRCRLCGSRFIGAVELSRTHPIRTRIALCFGFEMAYGDGLPQCVCVKCSTVVHELYAVVTAYRGKQIGIVRRHAQILKQKLRKEKAKADLLKKKQQCRPFSIVLEKLDCTTEQTYLIKNDRLCGEVPLPEPILVCDSPPTIKIECDDEDDELITKRQISEEEVKAIIDTISKEKSIDDFAFTIKNSEHFNELIKLGNIDILWTFLHSSSQLAAVKPVFTMCKKESHSAVNYFKGFIRHDDEFMYKNYVLPTLNTTRSFLRESRAPIVEKSNLSRTMVSDDRQPKRKDLPDLVRFDNTTPKIVSTFSLQEPLSSLDEMMDKVATTTTTTTTIKRRTVYRPPRMPLSEPRRPLIKCKPTEMLMPSTTTPPTMLRRPQNILNYQVDKTCTNSIVMPPPLIVAQQQQQQQQPSNIVVLQQQQQPANIAVLQHQPNVTILPQKSNQVSLFTSPFIMPVDNNNMMTNLVFPNLSSGGNSSSSNVTQAYPQNPGVSLSNVNITQTYPQNSGVSLSNVNIAQTYPQNSGVSLSNVNIAQTFPQNPGVSLSNINVAQTYPQNPGVTLSNGNHHIRSSVIHNNNNNNGGQMNFFLRIKQQLRNNDVWLEYLTDWLKINQLTSEHPFVKFTMVIKDVLIDFNKTSCFNINLFVENTTVIFEVTNQENKRENFVQWPDEYQRQVILALKSEPILMHLSNKLRELNGLTKNVFMMFMEGIKKIV